MSLENQIGALIGGVSGYFLTGGNSKAVALGAAVGLFTPDMVKKFIENRHNPEVQRILLKIISSTAVGLFVGYTTNSNFVMALATYSVIQINNYYAPPLLFRTTVANTQTNQNYHDTYFPRPQ